MVQYNYYLINPLLKDLSIRHLNQPLVHPSNHPPVNSLIPTFILQTFFNLLTIHNRYTEKITLFTTVNQYESDLRLCTLPLCHFISFVTKIGEFNFNMKEI
jgi:hypothetical protein